MKKLMKKLIIFTLIALFALSAFSCNTQPPQPSETTDEITTDSELTTDETTTEAEVTTNSETTIPGSHLSPEELEKLSRIYELTKESRPDHVNVVYFPADHTKNESISPEISLKLGDREWHLTYQYSFDFPIRKSDRHCYSDVGKVTEATLCDDGSVYCVSGSLVKLDLSDVSAPYEMIPLLCNVFREWVNLSEFPFIEIIDQYGNYEFRFIKKEGIYVTDYCTVEVTQDGTVIFFFHLGLEMIASCSAQDIDKRKEEHLLNLMLGEICGVDGYQYKDFMFKDTLPQVSFVTFNDEVYIRYLVTALSINGTRLKKSNHDIIIPLDLLLEDNAAS